MVLIGLVAGGQQSAGFGLLQPLPPGKLSASLLPSGHSVGFVFLFDSQVVQFPIVVLGNNLKMKAFREILKWAVLDASEM